MNFDDETIFQTFVAESEEGLAVLEESLIHLEAGREPDEALQAMFRAAHTLKGNALNLDLPEVAELAHALEDVLGRLRARSLQASERVVTALLQAVDLLRALVHPVGDGSGARATDHKAVLDAVRAFAEEIPTLAAAVTAPFTPALPPHEAGHAARGPYDSRGHTLRVNIETLDRLLNLTGELAVARSRVEQALEHADGAAARSALEVQRESDRLHADLQELVMKARMVAIGPALRLYRRPVRDIAAAHGKQAQLVIEGEDVEVDTRVVEHLRDPLTHMIRNALDHGVEGPDERRRRGKPPCGRIRVAARHEAGRVLLEVEDDGRGLSCDHIREQAVRQGLVAAEAAAGLSEREVHKLIFVPGFSTAESVTDLSGRGVGLDVVRRNVEALRGTIAVSSREGFGTTLTLRLPLTVAIVSGFAVGVGDETYVVPLDSVLECIELPAESGDRGDATGVLNLRGQPMPYLRLRHQFGCASAPPEREHVVVVHHEGGRAGLAVDALLGESQTVLKPLGRVLGDVPGIAGAAVLGGGRVGLVLDVPGLLQDRLAAVNH